MSKQTTVEIPIECIMESKNVRTSIGDVSGLMESIRQNGLLHPLVVWPSKDEGIFELGWGHRRLEALRKLGWTKLVVNAHVIITMGPNTVSDALLKNLAENLQREPVQPIDLGKRCRELNEAFGLSYDEMHARLGIPKSTIIQSIELLQRVPEEFQKHIGYDRRVSEKPSGINASVAELIVRLAPLKFKTQFLFEAKRTKMTQAQAQLVLHLLKGGAKFAEALAKLDEYRITYIYFVINKKVEKELRAKYDGTPIQRLIEAALQGKVALPNNLIFGSRKGIRR